ILITAVCLIKLPDKIYTKNDETVPSIAPIGNTITKVDDDSNKYELKFLGMIPLKSVEVEKIKDLELYPGGVPIGVRVSSEGVLVVGYSDIEINNEKEESPGKVGGLEIGDVILKINGIEMHNSRDLVKAIKQSEKDSIKVDILRH
ncbi:PDZ domain-containing protein, partial [Clostridioides difficile]|uniref:PDZ domain-containing protein n=1 Tax=Clostridioides difficile TaxID=1496 RepID=UPI002ED377FA